MKNSRLIAFDVLYKIFGDNAYSNIAIDKAISNSEATDKAFVSKLVYGVVERKLTLEYIADMFLTGKTKPKVKLVLLMGIYQLYFMDKVPASAAINESVELVKSIGLSYYSKVVNAVLRKADSNRIDIEKLDDLSVKYSCPQNLINMWNKMYGEDNTLKILDSINEKPPVFAVANTLYLDDADELVFELNECGIEAEEYNGVAEILSRFDLSKCNAFKNGLFHIEDISSFECAKALGAKENDVVIDMCSAPGGKAFTIAECMNNKGKIYAFDLYESRVKLIDDGAKRLGIDIIEAKINDAEKYNDNIPLADKILCDVTCSGFGIVRRKPEIRYKNLDSIKDLPNIQYKILETSSKYLKDNGKMVYSTCTLNKKENEKVVEKFLALNKNFKLVKQKTIFTSKNGGDGFYYAVLEKYD